MRRQNILSQKRPAAGEEARSRASFSSLDLSEPGGEGFEKFFDGFSGGAQNGSFLAKGGNQNFLSVGNGKNGSFDYFRQQVGKRLDEPGIENNHFAVDEENDIGKSDGKVFNVSIQNFQGIGILLFYQADKAVNIGNRSLQTEIHFVNQTLLGAVLLPAPVFSTAALSRFLHVDGMMAYGVGKSQISANQLAVGNHAAGDYVGNGKNRQLPVLRVKTLLHGSGQISVVIDKYRHLITLLQK